MEIGMDRKREKTVKRLLLFFLSNILLISVLLTEASLWLRKLCSGEKRKCLEIQASKRFCFIFSTSFILSFIQYNNG